MVYDKRVSADHLHIHSEITFVLEDDTHDDLTAFLTGEHTCVRMSTNQTMAWLSTLTSSGPSGFVKLGLSEKMLLS